MHRCLPEDKYNVRHIVSYLMLLQLLSLGRKTVIFFKKKKLHALKTRLAAVTMELKLRLVVCDMTYVGLKVTQHTVAALREPCISNSVSF